MTQAQTTALEEWKRGWTLVLACFVGFSFFSIPTAALSMYIEPITAEFGWGRGLVVAGTSMSAVVTALLSAPVGALIDKYGARRLGVPGVAITAVAMASISLANGSPAQWLGLWAFCALVSITVKTTVWTAPISGLFDKGRGLAIGITLCGTAAAQAIAPPLSNWLIDQHGWRQAYAWTALGWGGLALLLAWLFLYDAKDRKRLAPAAAETLVAADLPGLTIPQAWRSRALWSIAASTFVMMFLSLGLQLHQVPIVTAAGMTRSNAAWLVSLFGIAGIVGKLVTGALLDRFRPNWIGGLTLALNGVAFAILLNPAPATWAIVAAILINGYSAGTKLQICTYLTSSYAGLRNIGAVFGAMYSLVALGSGLGPTVAGFIFDGTGSYTAFLLAGVVGCLFSGAVILTLPRYPDWKATA